MPGAPASPLTPRQAQILELSAQGFSGKEIARRLGISVRTVEDHFSRMRQRTGTRTEGELVAYGIAAGMVTCDNAPPVRHRTDRQPSLPASTHTSDPGHHQAPPEQGTGRRLHRSLQPDLSVPHFQCEAAQAASGRLTEILISMLRSKTWHAFREGTGSYRFLPGEFDYFLTQRGVRREDVMKLPGIMFKAELEAAMDERRTGEQGYRRPVLQARKENPQVPGRLIEPFGYTQAEAKTLVSATGTDRAAQHREPLGHAVRRLRNTDGKSSTEPADNLPRVERLRRSALRLGDEDLAALLVSLKQERRRRRQPRH